MSYNCPNEGGCRRILRFSTPNEQYNYRGQNYTLGTNRENNARQISETAWTVLQNRGTVATATPTKAPSSRSLAQALFLWEKSTVSSGVGSFVVEVKLSPPPTESPTNLQQWRRFVSGGGETESSSHRVAHESPHGYPDYPDTHFIAIAAPHYRSSHHRFANVRSHRVTVVTNAYRATINTNAHYHNTQHSLKVPRNIVIFFHSSIPISVVGAQHSIPSNVPSPRPTRCGSTTPSLHPSRSPTAHPSVPSRSPSTHPSLLTKIRCSQRSNLNDSIFGSLSSAILGAILHTEHHSPTALPTTTSNISYMPLRNGVEKHRCAQHR
eukprot:CAMPEP_0194398770 /NCGR_PEP_ID=MMETSP0174-20130528/126293_1 /TAXON_ID=216777 /ORGANISM="Proboscia alata, Strain PI-D3" /LENGTH=322 /DNA_ID=CAMNT_0039195113 /DNA_START=90 /DNA_END=1058 /DNA_ORIENTATION=-